MLPGLRFLFASTLICTSLLLFGMGAIALLRASHQQFASLPPRQPPEPVFAQAPQTVPSLSMLRVEPDPQTPAATAESQREASLTNAERGLDSPPVTVEPKAPEPSAEMRSNTKPPDDPPPMPEVIPLADKSVAEAPVAVAEEPKAAAPDTAPAVHAAIAPETTAPEPQASQATGSIAMPEDQPIEPQVVVVDPPLPQPRPEVAALPPKVEAAAPKSVSKPGVSKPSVSKPAVKRKIRQAKRHRLTSERLPAATSAPTLGSLFGGNN